MKSGFEDVITDATGKLAAACIFVALTAIPAQSADNDAARDGTKRLQLAHCCHAHPVYPYDQNCCHPPTTTYVAPAYGVGPASVRGTSRRTARRTSRRVSRRR
ncbi:MAG: hypothetical protein MPJ78_17660 [Hyphomicrobiaceae bacterium]|nr:hypothetical protein [Hyphomicrobiaceae bacterium]